MIETSFFGQVVKVPESVAASLARIAIAASRAAEGDCEYTDLKLFTHEPGPANSIRSHELNVSVPKDVAGKVVGLFYENPGADTSVHEDTLAQFHVPA